MVVFPLVIVLASLGFAGYNLLNHTPKNTMDESSTTSVGSVEDDSGSVQDSEKQFNELQIQDEAIPRWASDLKGEASYLDVVDKIIHCINNGCNVSELINLATKYFLKL